jgi:hypothetical protein
VQIEALITFLGNKKPDCTMKLPFVPFAVSLVLGGVQAMKGPVTDSGLKGLAEKRRLNQEFMRAMHDDPKIQAAQAKQKKAQRKLELMEKMYASSRKLQNSYGEYTFENYEWMNPVYQQMIEDGVFDMTARAFKYSGCAAIKSFDQDRAAQNGNPMVIDTYAVFRLCPEETCNNYSLTGCGKNYGEYVVEMKTYLGYMLEYYEDRYGAYCDYCYPCDYDYQVLEKQTKSQCYENVNQQDYDYQQQQQQQAWQDYYEKNYGDMSNYYADQQAQYDQQQQQDMYNQQYGGYGGGGYGAGGYGGNRYGGNGYGGGGYGGYGGGNRKLDGGYYSNFVNSCK